MKRRTQTTRDTPRCVLDSGGLSALAGRSQRAREWLKWLLSHRGTIVVPTAVLVETITGDAARDAETNRVLSLLATRYTSRLAAPDERIARRAGRLRFRARTDDGIDALVASEAAGDGSPCVLLTADPSDMKRLLVDEENIEVRVV